MMLHGARVPGCLGAWVHGQTVHTVAEGGADHSAAWSRMELCMGRRDWRCLWSLLLVVQLMKAWVARSNEDEEAAHL